MADQQGLDERDYKILTAGFLDEELGKKEKYTYVKRSAIHRRLRLVDRNWTNHVETYIQVDGDTVTAWGSITLKGVTRYNSATQKVNCWASKENGGARFSDADIARELANAKMKAVSALIFRCAEAFEVGLYLKEKRTPHTLASVLNEQKPEPPQPTGQQQPTTPSPVGTPTLLPPPETKHWALNGDGEKIKARMNQLGLTGNEVLSQLEPGKTLAKLSDTTLTYAEVYRKMDEIYSAKVAAELDVKRKAQPPKPDEVVPLRGEHLQVYDLVYGLGTHKPKRLIAELGETEDGQFVYWAVWSNSDFVDSVTRALFEKTLMFKVQRTGESVELPANVLQQLEQLKHEQQALREDAEATT